MQYANHRAINYSEELYTADLQTYDSNIDTRLGQRDSTLQDNSRQLNPFVTGDYHSGSLRSSDSYISRNLNSYGIGDWYFVIIVGILVFIAWIRVAYPKYITTLFISSYSFQTASKTYQEKSIIHRRVGYLFDILYFLSGALFLLQLYHFYDKDFLNSDNFGIFAISFAFLAALVMIRVLIMTLIGHIFNRFELFKSFLYHYYIFTKVIGIILLPFMAALPYTRGAIHNMLLYSALTLVALIIFLRAVRIIMFVRKNVLLLFYLILYLCTVELLPLTVIIKVILSLT